jgi:hypothetical protein
MKLLIAMLTLFALSAGSHAQAKVDRPPQYVVFAFDGSKSIPMWNETREFSKAMTAQGKPVKFTYFINADYYLADAYRSEYEAPGIGPGRSAIGFGGTVDSIIERFKQTNLARSENNEIANHSAGHFDGSRWTQSEWHEEFSEFYDIIFNLFKYNHVADGVAASLNKLWMFNKQSMIGYRAPQLGVDKGMYEELPNWGIKYDTSGTSAPNLWPRRNQQGLWSFPLAEIPIAGTNHKTLSMDYNFYYYHTRGKEDPAHEKQYEEQMYQSYVDYFFNNYNGNRAPINIGHHFSKWNGGAYWAAERRFIQLVCGLPEVKCVTYEELMPVIETMEKQNLIARYQAGDFEKTQFPKPAGAIEPAIAMVQSFMGASTGIEDLDQAVLMQADPPEAHDE